jgi:peptidoglycan/xylan/chitin deacetylase (PgdA/CDA1 family)
VDDGHGDFYTEAFPIFRSFEIPVTVYLTTGFLNGDWLWFDYVNRCFAIAQADRFEDQHLDTPARRAQAAYKFTEGLKCVSNSERLTLVAGLALRLSAPVESCPTAAYAPLRWEQVRAMRDHHIEFGAHTVTHPILANVNTETGMLREIGDSKAEIERQLGDRVRHFCYPNGKRADISSDVINAVRDCGFETSVTTESGLNTSTADLLLLKRMGVDPDVDPLFFKQQAAVLRP